MVGKKKRNHPDIEELLARPWCYYCERDFDDLKILISHQKAKHFKCERCGRRLNTAGGLSVHMNQVHKETLAKVDNSLPNRQGLEVEIFGMEGIPEDVAQSHNQRIIAVYYQAEAERRAATGNSGPMGPGSTNGQTKKPKLETPAELKKRLAEHKARKAEQAAASVGSNGANAQMGGDHNSPMGQSPVAIVSILPAQIFTAKSAGYSPFSQEPYSQPAVAYQQPFSQQPPFSGAPGAAFQPQYSPPQQYTAAPSFTPNFPPGPSFPTAPQFGANPLQNSFNYQPPPAPTPTQHSTLPNRPPSLPPAPGLPQRPSFGAPPVPSYQMQQLHQGPPQGGWITNGWKSQEQKPAMSSAYPHPHGYIGDHSTNASSVDDPVSGTTREKDDIDEIIRMAEAGIKPPKPSESTASELKPSTIEATQPSNPGVVLKAEDKNNHEEIDKKTKKDKPINMIYSDNVLSPEERMARMPRYAFVPEGMTEPPSVDAITDPGIDGTINA
ncbi:hypothetical protein K3495_g6672 [Podosphaera aphanis]|nr:hypothetical protein K3495_g6672 [Podosphaera aphanis]